jgi:hypothetical protein
VGSSSSDLKGSELVERDDFSSCSPVSFLLPYKQPSTIFSAQTGVG